MVQATDRFLAQIRKSHQMVSYVDVAAPDQGTVRLPVLDGDIKVDRTAAVRRSCTISCIDRLGTLVPRGIDSLLTPYGTEIRPYRGVRYRNDNTEEVYPLGVFRLAKVNVTDSVEGGASLSLEAFDLSRTVSRDKFIVPYTIAASTNVVTAIKEILKRTVPNAEYDSISTTITTTAPMLFDAGNDAWEAATGLARSIGCDVYFDTAGRVVIAPPYDLDALPNPAFTYIEGAGSTMIDLALGFTDEPGYNGVIVSGQSTGDELPPVRAEAWDEEPTSPTYRNGPYGEVPLFVTDSVVKTQSEAQAMASSLLSTHLGFSSQLSITSSVNPALEAGDIVQVVRQRSGISGLFVADAFNVPLHRTGTQALTLRQKRTVG